MPKKSSLETKHLIATGIGILMPIPLLGEAITAYGLNPIIKETGLVKNEMNLLTSLATAGLIRMSFYKPFYLPTLDYLSKFL